eukprot:845914_1
MDKVNAYAIIFGIKFIVQQVNEYGYIGRDALRAFGFFIRAYIAAPMLTTQGIDHGRQTLLVCTLNDWIKGLDDSPTIAFSIDNGDIELDNDTDRMHLISS